VEPDLSDVYALAARLEASQQEVVRLRAEKAQSAAQLEELHEYVAQMCERFGDDRDEVPCDAWRLRDNIIKVENELKEARAEIERLQSKIDDDWHNDRERGW
jgi:hypothetical protein